MMIKTVGRLLKVAAAAFFVACAPAHAQFGVANHGLAVGHGPGAGSFNSVGPCLAGIPVIGAGVSADPVCGRLPFAGMVQGGAWTFRGNPTSAPADVQDFSIGSLAVKGSPVTNDLVIIQDSVDGSLKKATAGSVTTVGSVASVNGLTGAVAIPIRPGGRLTLTTGTPVMSADVAGANQVYYTPAVHRFVPIYDGIQFVPRDVGGELSQLTTDATKSPAAVVANSNYDVFVWNDSGTFRATRGPPWSSDSVRGAGAGTTELQLLNGIYVNKNAIASGPGAQFGTYVGTIRSNGSNTIDWKMGTSAAGGGEARLCVWNVANRRPAAGHPIDSNANWSYTSATVRPSDNSVTNRVSFVVGLQEDALDVSVYARAAVAGTFAFVNIGFGVDSTTTFDKKAIMSTPSAATTATVSAATKYSPTIGFHFIQQLEASDGTNANVIYGTTEAGLSVGLPM